MDVAQFLSIAPGTPIYTESLPSAFITALESYIRNVKCPTPTIMTANTCAAVSTNCDKCCDECRASYQQRGVHASYTTGIRLGMTSETVSEVGYETTLPN